jgi:hypothetical protein
MELASLDIAILIFVALLAGAINTVAGGGSNLVLPTLMIMGMPPEVANATNRVGIFVESVVAISEFKRHDKLETFDLKAISNTDGDRWSFWFFSGSICAAGYPEASAHWNDDLHVTVGPISSGSGVSSDWN